MDLRRVASPPARHQVAPARVSAGRPQIDKLPDRYRPIDPSAAICDSVAVVGSGARLPTPAELWPLQAKGTRVVFSNLALRETAELLATPLHPGTRERVQGVVFSVDDADTKDLDNALSFRREADGSLVVGVHAVDLSAWIRPGSALDFGARERRETRYLEPIAIPMLPVSLCEGMLSLNQGQLRLTKSVELRFDPDGRLLDTRIFRSELVNTHRLDPAEAAAAARGQGRGVDHPELAEALDSLTRLGARAKGATDPKAAISISNVIRTFTVRSALEVGRALEAAPLEASFRNQAQLNGPASYGAQPTGHAGEGGSYARWTGPMRRYADLDVHRAMDWLIDGARPDGRLADLDHHLRERQLERLNSKHQSPGQRFDHELLDVMKLSVP